MIVAIYLKQKKKKQELCLCHKIFQHPVQPLDAGRPLEGTGSPLHSHGFISHH